MSLAWVAASVFVIALLLPGISFLVGLWSHERHSREIVRSSALTDIGAVLFFSILIHLGIWISLAVLQVGILNQAGFDLLSYFLVPVDFGKTTQQLIKVALPRIIGVAIYIEVAAAIGYGLGYKLAEYIIGGSRRVGTHRWVPELIRQKGAGGVLIVYVMTNLKEDGNILMYKGQLDEFYLEPNGCFSYLVLSNTSRYLMSIKEVASLPTSPIPLRVGPSGEVLGYERFVIHGSSIVNVLIETLAEKDIPESPRGTRALLEAKREIQDDLEKHISRR